MTRLDAKTAIKNHLKDLDTALDNARSQFSIRMCYVNAHANLVDLARQIAEKVES